LDNFGQAVPEQFLFKTPKQNRFRIFSRYFLFSTVAVRMLLTSLECNNATFTPNTPVTADETENKTCILRMCKIALVLYRLFEHLVASEECAFFWFFTSDP